MVELAFLLLNIAFWISLGMTEGFKWTITPTWITAKNYHIYRGITNASFVATAILAGASAMGALKVIAALVASWPLYELFLNKVAHGSMQYQKKDFVLGKLTFKHPPVASMFYVMGVGLFAYTYLTIIG